MAWSKSSVSKNAVAAFYQADPPVSFCRNEFKPDATPLGILLEVEAIVGAWVTADGDWKAKGLKPQT